MHLYSIGQSGSDVGGNAQISLSDIGLYLVEDETMALTAQNVAGTTNVTIRYVLNWLEEF